mgnify:CR=1 FL=1
MKIIWQVLQLSLLLTSSTLMAETVTLSFGVVPQQAASKLAKLWIPILQHVSREVGVDIRFKTASNIPVFEQRLGNGDYDLAYMNPYHYVVFHEKLGYQAFAKQMNKHIKGIMVVHKDSDIKDIKQLQGKTLAFPSPAAFAASLLTRAHLKNQGVDFQAKYVSSHDAVYFNVAKKIYPAGGGILRTLNSTKPNVLEQLKVFWVSKPYTPHAFAARSDIPEEIVKRIRDSLRDLNNTEEGKEMLAGLKFSGIESADDLDWNGVRDLNLQELSNYLPSAEHQN